MSRENPTWGAPRIHGELLKLGIEIAESTVSKYLVPGWRPPSQTWRTFLQNHIGEWCPSISSLSTIRFQVLYVFLVLVHEQLREAFPWDTAPRFLLRDRDRIFSSVFVEQVRARGIKQVLSAPRSPWQRAYVERVIGRFVGSASTT